MNKKNFIGIVLLVAFLSSCQKRKTTLFSKIPSSQSGVLFNNEIIETDSFNILTSEYIFNGGGVAVGDFNNDKKPDLFFSGNQVANKLYLNQGNFKFKDVSKETGIEVLNRWNTGIALVDINNDGLLDIYVCSAMLSKKEDKKNLFFVNQGLDENQVPRFIDMAEKYGIEESGNSMGATFFDYDNDGLLDLYVLNNVDIHVLPSNYREKITDGSALSNDRLYRNNGNGTFSDVTIESGITIEGYGLGLAIADLNYDGWSDIYISNDYLTNDILYINNQDGTFTNQIKEKIKHQSKFSMGNDISDYNNDGYLDIITLDMLGETNQRLKTTLSSHKYNDYILNEKFDYEYQYTRNMLQKGNGNDIPYSEIGLMAGISKTDWSWSPLFADMDNDGYKDLLITNGFPRDITDLDFGDFKFNVSRYLSPARILDSIPRVKIPNYAFKNNHNDSFTDVSKLWGIDVQSFSNGAAFADLDDDGDLDYVVNNIDDEAFIFKNNINEQTEPSHNFLVFALDAPRTTNKKVGAKILIKFDDGTFQYQENHLYRGFMSTVQDIFHFGLGNKTRASSVEILWSDGKYQKLANIKSNQKIILKYQNASNTTLENLSFPFTLAKNSPILKEVSKEIGISYVHQEKDMVDFNAQRIIPHKFTENGPCLAVADINGDGTEDFIVGSSSGFSPQLFFQDIDGNFNNKALFNDKENMKYEEEGIIFFDLENDGDMDMYLVSGSNEFDPEEIFYTDRLLLNDGTGNFTISKDRIPPINSSGSVVVSSDYNNDGFVDLFVGGRTPFAQYPSPDKSYLLKNEKGYLNDVTDTVAPELRNIGMLTDAIWADIDTDGREDLIVIGELMAITILKNDLNGFNKIEKTGIENLLGWWESIVKTDLDNDGDIDFIVGNIGKNNIYQPSAEKPVTLISKDFDNNGNIDPVMFAYFKESFENPVYKPFPVNFWGDLYGQSPIFRAKYNSFKSYSKATISNLFSKEELEGSTKLIGNYDKSIFLENLGDGKFHYKPLPNEAQVAPINSMNIIDFDNDGTNDILMVGNNFGNEIFIGKYDAFNGAVLKNDGKGNLKFIPTKESGFLVPGDAKKIVKAKNSADSSMYYIVSQNRDSLKVFIKCL